MWINSNVNIKLLIIIISYDFACNIVVVAVVVAVAVVKWLMFRWLPVASKLLCSFLLLLLFVCSFLCCFGLSHRKCDARCQITEWQCGWHKTSNFRYVCVHSVSCVVVSFLSYLIFGAYGKRRTITNKQHIRLLHHTIPFAQAESFDIFVVVFVSI